MIDPLTLLREIMEEPEPRGHPMHAFAHSLYHDIESERLPHADACDEEQDDPAGNLDD